MKRQLLIISMMMTFITVLAQQKVYDDSIDPFAQIDQAVEKAKAENKLVAVSSAATGADGV